VFRVPQIARVRDNDRGDGAQLGDDLPGVVEPAHVGIAGGEKAMRQGQTRVLLDDKPQFCCCFLKAPTDEMRRTKIRMRPPNPSTRAEAQRLAKTLNGGVWLSSP
jgi:hypothetical protein